MANVKVGIIGGSGLGDALCGQVTGRKLEVDTPFGKPSDAVIEAEWDGVPVALLNRHGPGHLINPSRVNYRANIFALKSLGCTHIISSAAVGSLREKIRPKHLVIPDQIIDKTHLRKGTFYDEYFAAHVEFAAPFCPVLRRHLLNCADAVATKVHDGGTYVCMEGPAFSTRAESEMHRKWGGDLIGMTAMPEAKLAREAEIAYALVALPSDYDCWRPVPADLDKHELLKEIIGNLTEATGNAITLIKAAISRFGAIAEEVCPAHSAMELAIWSDRARISSQAKEKLGPLVSKYL
jgi:5'-methylthioadenosine phosphorylase